MKRIAACVLASVLLIGVTARSAAAQKSFEGSAPLVLAETPAPAQSANNANKPNQKLKADVAKLVAETKAGKRSVMPSNQFPTHNSLSKKWKIGIVVGVAVVVIAALIIWKSFEYHCESRCVL